MSTLRSLALLAIFAASVFLVGLSLGIQLSQDHTSFSPANSPSPNFAATIAALEEQVKRLQATVGPVNVPPPATTLPEQSQPTGAAPPTPTLRVVTRATLTAQPRSREEVAAAIARAYLGGGEVVKVEHEKKYGTDVFEVKFKYGSEVYVDVQGGRVLYAEVKPADLTTPHTPLPPTSTPTLSPLPSPTPEPTAPPVEEQPSVSLEDDQEQPHGQQEEDKISSEEPDDAEQTGSDTETGSQPDNKDSNDEKDKGPKTHDCEQEEEHEDEDDHDTDHEDDKDHDEDD